MTSTIARVLASLAIPVAVSCAGLLPGGPVAAADLDPLRARPQDIAVAIGVPAAFRLQSGDASLHMSFRARGGAEAAVLEETVSLRILPDATGRPEGGAGERVHVARIAAADQHRLARLQSRILDLKARGVGGVGAVSVAVSGGCVAGPVPETLPVSSWLQTDPAAGFVRLTSGEDVFARLDPSMAARLRGNFTPCQ